MAGGAAALGTGLTAKKAAGAGAGTGAAATGTAAAGRIGGTATAGSRSTPTGPLTSSLFRITIDSNCGHTFFHLLVINSSKNGLAIL